MKQADIREHIILYYQGKLSNSEINVLLEVMNMHTTAELEALYPSGEWNEIQVEELPVAQVEAALAKHRKQRKPVTSPAVVRRLPVLSWSVKAACIAALLIAGAWMYTLYQKDKENKESLVYKMVQVPDGKRTRVQLADGSIITVAGGTRLRIPQTFNGSTRDVFLDEGEAFFEVHRDTTLPFIVHTGHMEVQVLGTSFSVRDYADEANGIVSVRTGKVGVRKPGEKEPTMLLLPGDQSILHKQEDAFVKTITDTAAVFGWMQGVYIFRNATLAQITSQLSHNYPVNFDIRNKAMLDKRFSATFRHNSITEIMEQLRLMNGIRYTMKNNRIIID
ncbi:MAG: FecR domain-containing protein [Chitinophagaceae bacterium]